MNLDRRLLAEAGTGRLYLALTVGAALLVAVAVVLQAAYLSRVVTAVFLERATLDDVRGPLGVLLAVIATRAGLTSLREVLASEAAVRIKADLRNRLFARLFALGPLYVSGERTGELANTLLEGVESLDAYFSQYLPSLVLAALIPATILLFVFPIDLLSGFVFLITAPLIPAFMILIGKLADLLARRQWESLSRMNAHFLDVLQGLTTLKLFNRSRAQTETIVRVTDHFRDTTLGVLRVAFLSALALEIVGSISTAIVAVEVGLRLLYSGIGFEQAFFILVLAPEFYLPLRTLGASFHAGMSGVAAARRIYEVLGDGKDGMDGRREASIPSLLSHPSFPSTIEFREVSLSYDSGERAALGGVSFEVRRGEKVALVGPSGAGKSSIASLLLRFVEPDAGQITLDGVPTREIPADWWREQVAWVPQNPYLFAGTIEDNIRLGHPGASPEKIELAARRALVDEFVSRLRDGYATVIGERGVRLSGGQAQRIALARAFIKDAPILILDEPTSNLDPESETMVQEAVNRLVEGRMVLVIAHRLSTVRDADRIMVLDEGRVAEQGTHEELMERGGLYSRLIAANGGDRETGRQGDGARGSGLSSHPAEAPSTHGIEASAGSTTHHSLSHSRTSSLSHSSWVVISRLFSLVAPYRWWMALATILGFATVGAGIGLITTAAFLIASAARHPSVADLAVPIVGVRFFGISRGVFRYLERYVSHNVTFRLLGKLRVWFYETVEPLAPAGLVWERSGDLLNRAVADVEALQHFYVRVIAPPLVALTVSIAICLLMWRFDPALAVFLGTFLLVAGVVLPLGVYDVSAGPSAEMAKVRSEMSAALADGIQGMADLLVYGEGRRRREVLERLGRRWAGLQRRMIRISGTHSGLEVLLANAGCWAVLVASIPIVAKGTLDGVFLPVLVLAALASFEAVAPLSLAFQQLGTSIESARRLLETAEWGRRRRGDTEMGRHGDEEPGRWHSERSTQNSAPYSSPITHHPSLISVRDLRFRYGPTEPWALDGISFDLAIGSKVAIVGPSGAGKSTLASLLVRFWDYQEGTIALLGRDLREWSPEEARERIAVVPQLTHLFNATLRENLLLARPGAGDDLVARAAERAGLRGFVLGLPKGYDTWIGEQGLRLSGGERQRVAIARALLRDAPLLVLDEPASNLDSLVERQIMESIWAGVEGRGLLLITHRLASLDAVNEILVMDRGRVVERGSHHDLLRAGGFYRRMWDLQQQGLRELLERI